MAWCLIKSESAKFKQALIDGKINPETLSKMSSEVRHEFFLKFTGETNATKINSLFESKLLLKNQQRGFITWANRVGGMKPVAKRDMIARIKRMEDILSPAENEQFLKDLATTRLGLGVSEAEAKTIATLSKEVTRTKSKAKEDGTFNSEEQRLEYGASVVNLETYVGDLKLESKKVSFKEEPLSAIKKAIGETPGTLKSIVASLDNSFWGRQGIKVLLNPKTSNVWFKNFAKSWKDIGSELKGGDAMYAIKADIYSRPNAINGKYQAGGYGLNVLSEEAFPSSIPEKIPGLGRLFKASESAYNGGALRLRADLADRYIKLADEQGINTLDKAEAQPMGQFISSLTGRGSLGRLESASKSLNVLFFSVKFAKSNLDTLVAPISYGAEKVGLIKSKSKGESFARKQSAMATANIIMTLASILTIAKLLFPDSVEEDPRSTNFGKIKLFGKWTDITGGMASLVVLASRLIKTEHNGDKGFWYKTSAGNYIKLGKNYGSMTALDVAEGFVEGKLSPIAGILRDIWKEKDFSGKKTTVQGELENSLVPISIQTYKDLVKDPKATPIDVFGSMLLDALGASVSTYLPTEFDWNEDTGKTINQFKDKVGQEKFDEANKKFNKQYTQWLDNTVKTDEYKNLSDDGKATVRTNGKAEYKGQIFKEYNFKYKTTKKTPEEKAEKKVIDKLVK